MNSKQGVEDRIRVRMAEKNLKQTNVADAIGASKGTISKWLAGKNVPKNDYLIRLARLLHTTPEWIISGTGHIDVDDVSSDSISDDDRDYLVSKLGLQHDIDYDDDLLMEMNGADIDYEAKAFNEEKGYDMISEYRVERLKEVLAELKRQGYKSYASIDRKFHVSASYLSQLINGVVPLGETAARNIEEKLGLPAYFLDNEFIFISDNSNENKEFHTDYVVGSMKSNVSTNIAIYSSCELVDDNIEFAGITDYVEMTVSFFTKYDVEPDNYRMIVSTNDSMKPYVNKDDIVGVDISKTTIEDGEIYLMMFDSEVMIKQVFREGGGALRLHSFNADYPDRTAQSGDYHIVGKQIYRAG